MRTCAFKHPDPAATADACHLCRLYVTRPDYRELWDRLAAEPPAKRKMTFAEAAAARRR